MSNEVLLPLQLTSAVVWTIVGAIPLLRKTFKSPGGWAFSLFAFSIAIYAVLDSLLSAISTPNEALLYIKLTGTAGTIGVLFFLYFAKWMTFHRRRVDLLLTIPTTIMVVLVWSVMTESVVTTSWGLAPVRNVPLYVLWFVYLYAYSSTALAFLWRGATKYRTQFPKEYAMRIGVITSLAAILIAGVIVITVTGPITRPLLSSILVVPGLALVLSLAPLTGETITSLVRRVANIRREILHSFLIYHGGSLIASRSLDGHSLPDEDMFSAVLEAIQRCLNLNIPMLGGGWLDAIDHGDLKILTERGKHCFLVLVTTGREDDLLRGEMRDVLRRFEERNADVLVKWDGDVNSTTGANDAVDLFFDLDKVF